MHVFFLFCFVFCFLWGCIFKYFPKQHETYNAPGHFPIWQCSRHVSISHPGIQGPVATREARPTKCYIYIVYILIGIMQRMVMAAHILSSDPKKHAVYEANGKAGEELSE